MKSLYLAGPWFNPDQSRRYEAVLAVCDEWRLHDPNARRLVVPRDDVISPDADEVERERIYESNVTAIADADVVVAITDEKDLGTIFELGYAAALREVDFSNDVRIIAVALDLGDRPFNVMLAQAVDSVATSIDELGRALLDGEDLKHGGRVE